MIRSLINNQDKGFEWVDMTAPGTEEIKELGEKYGLAPESVEDVMQPEHLPKYEMVKDYVLVILRMYNVTRESDADTVRELTNKVAIFLGNNYIITIHKHPWDALDKAGEMAGQRFDNPKQVLLTLTSAALQSFEPAAARLSRTIDYFEEHVFLKDRKTPLLKSLYFLKRKVEVINTILQLSKEIIERIHAPESAEPATRNISDLYVRLSSLYRSLADNTNHLLGVYFNISSQRTNETIRVLTIFSVFFMPLTFLVGVYGMNFDFMPELRYKWGYLAVWGVMLLIVTGIYIWFKNKKWL